MDNKNNEIGCRSNKTVLVDPNAFDGQSSISNVSVPLEDLTISVELSTSKKARTVLTTEKNGTNTGESSDAVRINFIEGTEINGKKYLTSKFTDLTTVFDGGNEGENLGIKAIDVDFNSSYAPMITIDFIDVRGSAIFQNEERVAGSHNKYSVFFQLPYPLYQLTIKGYYGQPVKYCLHMLKFTSKFNSQTGNFEIKASFIGYTYAMLSDMLLGYLKAIEYTKLGSEKYAQLKAIDPNLLTLNELYKDISLINSNVTKIVATDDKSIELSKSEDKKRQLDTIETNLLILGQDIDIKKDLEKYNFIVVNQFNFDSNSTNQANIDKYVTEVSKNIELYNADTEGDFKLDSNSFTNVNTPYYSGLTLNLLNANLDYDPATQVQRQNQLALIFFGYDQTYITNTRKKLYEHITSVNNYGLAADQVFNVYDLRSRYDAISSTRIKIDTYNDSLKKALAETLRSTIRESLGFDSTVRNIVNVFTTAVEVFLYVLYEVSKKADDPTNLPRINQLKKFSDEESYDIKKTANGDASELTNDTLGLKYYPWPDYRSNNDSDGFIETYLGKPGILDVPSDVTELEFIDDLLKAFLTQSAQAKNDELELIESKTNWYPVNVLDTRIFIEDFPYKRIQGNNRSELMILVMLRAMTYLGYSNNGLSPEEIQAIASAEADAILTDINNPSILQSLTQVSTNDFLTAEATINAKPTRVVKELGLAYYYDFIFDSAVTSIASAKKDHILPLNNGFSGSWDPFELVERAKSGSLFLTNYTTTEPDFNDLTTIQSVKPDDGGVYVKILGADEYRRADLAFPLIAPPINPEITIDLSKLKLKADFPQLGSGVGFNVMGGLYGTQEFSKLNYGTPDLDGLPFRYVFYSEDVVGYDTFRKANGLGYKRTASLGEGETTSSDIDINFASGDTYNVAISMDSYMGTIDSKFVHTNQSVTNDEIGGGMHRDLGNNRVLINKYLRGDQTITYPHVNFQVFFSDANDGHNLAPVSLFGSRLYNEQTSDYSRALLFLHTFPWNGLASDGRDYNGGIAGTGLFDFGTVNNTIFDKPEILNIFSQRAGFISAPKLWVAFIGAMLWRADYSSPVYDSVTGRQIDGGSGLSDPLQFFNATESYIPTFGDELGFLNYPTKLSYLTLKHYPTTSQEGKEFPNQPMSFGLFSFSNPGYKFIDDVLLTLPDQVKNEFKKVFFDFVKSRVQGQVSDWELVKSKLEVWDYTPNGWTTSYDSVMNNPSALYSVIDLSNFNDNGVRWVLDKTTMRNTYPKPFAQNNTYNFDNYVIFTPIIDLDSGVPNEDFKYNYFLELRDGTQAVKIIMDLFSEEIIIANATYKIWRGNDTNNTTDLRENISVTKTDLTLYLDTIVSKINSVKSALSIESQKNQTEQEIFGTSDDNTIKLQLYKTCKNIYDKWVGGAQDGDNVIFQCGGRNAVDSQLAAKRGFSDPKLIDSFRFVTRSFKDIGDELVINPTPVHDYLRDNPNSSFYDMVTNLLTANNFDFIPLPAFINYNDEETLKSMFKPLSYFETETLNSGISGPSFVCVYLGQKSKHLDYADSDYTNDGFDVRCKEGNMLPGLPKDFTEPVKSGEDSVTFFAVNFGQQNQNIFKDITLDQSEFGETAESLQITDDISKKGSENNKTIAGQNIYNVYSVRSYKVEVEMMGNAMIQPMMYFQLNNIPMFHGAYMITHVKHNIKPNFMSTSFSGVRIRKPQTELLSSSDLFMSLLDTIDSVNIQKNTNNNSFGTAIKGAFPPIVATIIENGSQNGNIVSKNIKTKNVDVPAGILNKAEEPFLLEEAVEPFKLMLTDWVSWMKTSGFNGDGHYYAYINSMFRNIQKQQELFATHLKGTAATPGKSNHGWGIAVDIQFLKRNGGVISCYNNKEPNLAEGYNFTINESIVWLLENSYRYGWIIPEVLRDDTGTEEFWHFEYHGTSAACLLAKKPNIKGKLIDTTKPYVLDATGNPIVKNPLDANGVQAVYSNCDYRTVDKTLDGFADVLLPINNSITVTPPSNDDIAFYTSVLAGIGASATQENLKFCYAWRQAEAAKAAWNPFNTSQKVGTTTGYNCLNNKPLVKNYDSRDNGIKATITTLKNGYYDNIVNGLVNDVGAKKLSEMISDLTTWGTGFGVNKVLAGSHLDPPPISNTSVVIKSCS